MEETYEREWEHYRIRWAKAYLGRVRSTVHTVAMIRSEIADLERELDGLRGIDYAADKSGGTQDPDAALVTRIERMDSLRAEYAAELDDCLVAQARAHRALANVGQPMRAVLTYRYLEGMAWADVAEAAGFSEVHCKGELHDKGCMALYDHIPHEFDDMPEAV